MQKNASKEDIKCAENSLLLPSCTPTLTFIIITTAAQLCCAVLNAYARSEVEVPPYVSQCRKSSEYAAARDANDKSAFILIASPIIQMEFDHYSFSKIGSFANSPTPPSGPSAP